MTWKDKLEDFLRRGIDFDIAVQAVSDTEPFKNDFLNLRRTEKNRIENAVRAGYSLQQAFQVGLDDKYTANLYERYFIE